MALFLVQHGKSLPKDKDPKQGLSLDGAEEVERIAGVAKGYNVSVSEILCSHKKRAVETADIFASYLSPEKGVREQDGLAPLDDVALFAKEIDNSKNRMVVGHLPFMEKLTSYLLIGSLEKIIFKFQNGGILCLDEDKETRLWVIKWALMPKIS